jgi:uncharacterized protein YbjT (DUF2867 family)
MQSRSSAIPAPILVTGGTGTLGRLVVANLRGAGREVRILSRGRRGGPDLMGVAAFHADLMTGGGVADAVAGCEAIVHCAGTATGDDVKARNLMAAAVRAGAKHVVFISVVGADRIPIASALDRTMFGYFASKRAAEREIEASGVPWTTVRATQLFDLTAATIERITKLPIVPVPSGFRFQPVDAEEVAGRLVELALARPSGLVDDIGGPRIYEMAELVRDYLEAAGQRRPIVRLPVPGKAAEAIRAGANLAPRREVGLRTWEDFLATRFYHAAAHHARNTSSPQRCAATADHGGVRGGPDPLSLFERQAPADDHVARRDVVGQWRAEIEHTGGDVIRRLKGLEE